MRIADALAVYPYIERTHHPLEAEEGLTAGPSVGQLERAQILACGVALLVGGPVFLRFASDKRRVYLERIAGRDINRCAVTAYLPVGRHGDMVPRRAVKTWFEELGYTSLWSL